MDWTGITVRIDWSRTSWRRWPATKELARPYAPWRKKRNVLFYWWAGHARRHLPSPVGWVPIHAGICHWARPGWSYEVIQSARNPLGVTSIHFDLLDASGQVIPPQSLRLPPEQLTVRDPDMVDGITRRIAALALDRRAGVALSPDVDSSACGLLRGLLILLDHDTPPEMLERGKNLQAGWRRLTAHIHEHLHAIGGVRDLVKLSGYTRSHFARAFRLQMGISPREYLINARISLAKELLRESALSVTEVAQRAGYSEIFRFSRQFKQRTGLTPSDYRARQSAG